MEAAERARLVESHLDLPRKAAAMLFPRVKDHVEFDELVALGNAGLAEAASRFEPERGASFATFAWYRVHGAILDGLRKQSQLPRRVWAKLVALRAAADYLENRAERDAGAAQRGTPPPAGADALAAVRSAMASIRTMYMTSLEGLQEAIGFDASDPDTPAVSDNLDTRRLTVRLRDALATLPAKERALVTKHYWEGKNLLEAGEELGISKSWASRLHAQAVERLRLFVDGEPSVET